MRHSRLFKRIVLCLVIFFIAAAYLAARAGGAGGGGHSSGGSSGSFGGSHSSGGSGADLLVLAYFFDALVRIFWLIGPIPSLLIIASICVLVWLILRRSRHNKENVFVRLRRLMETERNASFSAPSSEEGPSFGTGLKGAGVQKFLKEHPDFKVQDFYARASTAFTEIQSAWSKKNLSSVRRFISDGVYQRFSTQFEGMNMLGQENRISNVRISSIRIDRAISDGSYDVLSAAISARMRDRFVCPGMPQLNSDGDSEFTEYWSFIRKKTRQGGFEADIFSSNSCPSCGGELPIDLGERCVCPFCSSLVNSGEFDWVLSEITQVEDYARERVIDDASSLAKSVTLLRKEDPEFCVQLIEDKASNAFLQILVANIRNEPAMMRRFCSDDVFERLKSRESNGIAYNRLYLNSVRLDSIAQDENAFRLGIQIAMTAQRVRILDSGRISTLDPGPHTEDWTIVLRRAKTLGGSPKGSLYQHQCSSCGAPVQDSLETTCGYCGQDYRASNYEWIVEDLRTSSEYRSLLKKTRPARIRQVNPSAYDRLYDQRDYVLGNLMVMFAADGVFEDEEREFARTIALRLGFRNLDLDALFHLANTGKLGIKMPNDVGKRQAIIDAMEDAARADGRVSPEETELLEQIRRRYLTAQPF